MGDDGAGQRAGHHADRGRWIAENLGWFYVVTVTVVIVFVLWVALSKEGSVRLGPDHSRPQYKLFTWVAMLFAAGVGIDMLFYSVTGPITQYMTPPAGEGQTAEAAQDAVVWTMFHYGVAGWAMYALLGMAMGYFAYRWGMPLSIRAALYRCWASASAAAIGDAIDIVTLVGTVFGVATSMGIGVVLLNVGFACCSACEQGLALQIALVMVAVVLTIAACTSGVDKGIRWISELNIWSAAAMLLYILVTGQTVVPAQRPGGEHRPLRLHLARTHPADVRLPGGRLGVDGRLDPVLLGLLAGLGSLCRDCSWPASRAAGRCGSSSSPPSPPRCCATSWSCSIFGNSAMHEVLGGNTAFAQLAVDSPEQGWYALLGMFPGAPS